MLYKSSSRWNDSYASKNEKYCILVKTIQQLNKTVVYVIFFFESNSAYKKFL